MSSGGNNIADGHENFKLRSTPMGSHSMSPSPAPRRHAIESVPPCDWTGEDLAYFRIEPTSVDIETFFGMPEENLRDINWADPGYKAFLDAEFLKPYSGDGAAAHTVGRAMDFLRRICIADVNLLYSETNPSEKTTNQLNDLLLTFVGLDKLAAVLCGQRIMLTAFNNSYRAEVDVALIDRSYSSYLFLCIGDKCVNHIPPFVQLMAAAIASFQVNNKNRALHRLKEYNHMIFPAMTFRGSDPCFYLIHVTKALVDAVAHGISPDFTTKVPFLTIDVHEEIEIGGLGLVYPSARKQVLKIMENLKDYIPSEIRHIPRGWLKVVTEAEI